MKNRSKPIKSACLAIAVAALAGCASMEPPTAEMAASRTAIEQARMSGATEGVSAADYASARAKLDRAEAAYRAEDYVLAGRLAREAEVDAQLAQARAASAKSRLALAQLEASTRALRDEIHRNSATPTTTIR
jgi:type IV pilus biogenesis protein CpaD/CtpE